MAMKIDFFSTLAQAKELAANPVDDLVVRPTVDDKALCLKMLKTLLAAPRDKLKIELPAFSSALVGELATNPVQRRLELVDNSQRLKTSYVFEKGALAVVVEVPGGRKKVLGANSAPEVFDVIFDALEQGLASIQVMPKKISIRTKPVLEDRKHQARVQAIAKRFGATLV